MSLTITYDDDGYGGGQELADLVAPSTIQVPQRAENGEPSFGAIPAENGAALVGHKPFVVEESACSQPRLFTGYTTQRDFARSAEDALVVADDRLTDVTIVDCNAAAGFRIIWDVDGNRPEETWDERLAWIISSDYLDPLIGSDTTFQDSHTNPMDAADYRDATPAAVLNDLVNRFDGAMNWFLFWNPDTSAVELAIFGVDDVIGDCTLLVSNVEADQDGVTIFAPDKVATLQREPDQVYSEVVVEYKNGRVYRSLEDTETAFIRRGTTISRPYTGKESTAIAQGDQFLVSHAVERDRIICVMRNVPDESVGLVRAGMRMQVKFTHLPGYETYQWMRIVACSPVPTSDIGTVYDVALELVSAVPVVEPTTTQMALLFSDTGCTTQDYPRTVMYDFLGDDPPPGWTPYATSGPVEALTCSNYEDDPGYYAIQVNGDGTVSIEHWGAYLGVSAFGDSITVSIRKNGTPIGTPYYWEDEEAGWGHGNGDEFEILVEDVVVEDGDYFDTYVEVVGWDPYYRSVGTPQRLSLTLWGTVTPSAGGSTTGDVIPTPTDGETTVSDAPPTTDDDETLGFAVGDHWLDTDTGIEYVLVDATDGAAVWVALNEPLEAAIEYVVDGGGSELTTGIKGFLEVPFACTITAARMFADQTGSAVVDVWADDYASFPPTVADTITASAKPTIAAGVKSEDTTLTGWTTALAAGDVVAFKVDSVSTITRLTISLTVTRT